MTFHRVGARTVVRSMVCIAGRELESGVAGRLLFGSESSPVRAQFPGGRLYCATPRLRVSRAVGPALSLHPALDGRHGRPDDPGVVEQLGGCDRGVQLEERHPPVGILADATADDEQIGREEALDV